MYFEEIYKLPNYLIKYGGNQKIVELEKIIDDYRLYYLNDLFEIKLIFYGLSHTRNYRKYEDKKVEFVQ